MPTQIIVLEKAENTDRGFRLALWARPPATRQAYWKLIAPQQSAYALATPAENTDIANGVVAEHVQTIIREQNIDQAAFQALAEDAWRRWDEYVQAYNPWRRYGTKWDGTTWALGGTP